MGNREVCRHHSNGGFYDTESFDCYICDMEQQLAVLSLENIRIVLEAKQCHEQNDRLVTEHYELRRELAELREAARKLLRGIEAYQYGSQPVTPLPGIAGPANELEALLPKENSDE